MKRNLGASRREWQGGGSASSGMYASWERCGRELAQLLAWMADAVCVTAPRQIIPQRTSLITRRCAQRQFLLRPDRKTREAFDYCLAEAASRYGIQLVAWFAMSNHYHAVAHDPDGRLPEFLEHFHKMVAKTMNARLGRWENFWSSEPTCVTHLPTGSDISEKVVYVLANAVAAHLVDRAGQWPGSSSFDYLDGRETVHARPRGAFFSENGRMPAEVKLRMEIPSSALGTETRASWMRRVCEAIEEREKLAAEDRRTTGHPLVGRKAVLRMSPFDSPNTSTPRRKLQPAIACKNKEMRLRLIEMLKGFRKLYEQARALFVGRDRGVEFPAGTYRFRTLGACCRRPLLESTA